MKPKYFYPIFFSLILLSFAGCSKYEEGCASFVSKSKRICRNWKVELFASVTDPVKHGMAYDVEFFSGDETAPVPYKIWYPSAGSWIGSWPPWYYGCESMSGLGIPVDSLVFRISDLTINFRSDNSLYISYAYNNREFDMAATNVNCDNAKYKDVTGWEEIKGTWKLSKDKKELQLSLNNSAVHFPLLDHCLRTKVYVKKLCKEEMKLEFGYNYYKNPGGIFPQGPNFFQMSLVK